MFGPVERAVVCTDERGRSLGYGIVDFYRKSHAQQAISRCRDDFFVLTRQVLECNIVCVCACACVRLCGGCKFVCGSHVCM